MNALNLSKDALKPCPYCGSVNLLVWSREVECEDCGATGPRSRQYASALWNRRHDETPSEFERLCGREKNNA